jgi:hypothetical protein
MRVLEKSTEKYARIKVYKTLSIYAALKMEIGKGTTTKRRRM